MSYSSDVEKTDRNYAYKAANIKVTINWKLYEYIKIRSLHKIHQSQTYVIMFEKFDFNAFQVIRMAEEEMMLLGLHHLDVDILVAGILKWYGDCAPKGLFPLTLAEYREKYVAVRGRGDRFWQMDITHMPDLKRLFKYAYDNNEKVTVEALVDAVYKQPRANLLLFKE